MSLLLLAACAPDPADDTGTGTIPDLPTSACGGEPYTWLPLEGMGEVLDAEPVDEWGLGADALRGLAGAAGLHDTDRIAYAARGYRVRYRTQDRGKDAEATMIVALPDAVGLTPPTLLYLHPTTGFEDFCAPSGRDLTWALVPLVLAGIGYAVAAPDYLGQNGFGAEAEALHPYLVAEPTAIASLDSVRALWAYAPEVGVTPTRTTAILGASQGGGAGLWVERYAPEWLPDADLVGSVLSVPALDLVGMADAGSETLSVASVGVPLTLYAMDAWYGLGADLGDVVQPDMLARVTETVETDCPSAEVPDDIDSVEDVYTDAWRAAVDPGDLDPWAPWSCMLAESSVGYAPVPRVGEVPTLVLLGGADEVTLVDVQRAAVDTLCGEGEPIVARECEGLEHTATVQATGDEQLDWIADRFAGVAVPATCGGIEVRSCE